MYRRCECSKTSSNPEHTFLASDEFIAFTSKKLPLYGITGTKERWPKEVKVNKQGNLKYTAVTPIRAKLRKIMKYHQKF
jgi:hypothetical protein